MAEVHGCQAIDHIIDLVRHFGKQRQPDETILRPLTTATLANSVWLSGP